MTSSCLTVESHSPSHWLGFGALSEDNGKTQLAVSIPIEEPLQSLLAEARDDVVNCVLLLSGMHSRSEATDVENSSTWIPEVAHIPQKDMHITVCIPSLWREPDADPKAHAEYNSQVIKALRLKTEV